MLELQLEIQLEGQINLEMEIQNTEIVVVEGFDYFDINWINPTLSAGTLTANFAFSPSPQEDVTKIELWINGSLAETRMSNDESPFVVNGIVGGAEVQIKAYNDSLLMQQSDVFQLPIPNAPDFIDFSFGSSKTIDIIAESSDPQNLPITIKYLGIPINGLVSLLDSDTISVQEIDRNNPTLIPYVIENSVGATDSGNITFHWEEISITIDTPIQNQEIPSDEDITVAFTVTPATQNCISAIALVVDGVEVEKRTPYSTDDFTIVAGALSVDSHNIMLRAYDVNDEVVYNSQAVSVDVVASFNFGNGLLTDGVDDFAKGSFTAAQGATKCTISVFANFNSNSDGVSISLHNSVRHRFELSNYQGNINVHNLNSTANQYRYPVASVGNGVHHLMMTYDGSIMDDAEKIKLYIDGNNVSLNLSIQEGDAGSISNLIESIYLGRVNMGRNKSLQTDIAIDVGRAATPQNAIDLWNNGIGADYRDVVGAPTSYWKIDESEPATTLVDEMGYCNLTLNNFSSPYLVDFENYAP